MIGNVMIDARSTGKYYHCKLTNPIIWKDELHVALLITCLLIPG